MLTHEKVAQTLNGREYPIRLSREEKTLYRENGIVIIHPYSDDGMEFDGAMDDEADCFNGGSAYVCREGVIDGISEDEINDPPDTVEDILAMARLLKGSIVVTAVASDSEDDPAWRYELPIPHSTFELMEDGEVMAVCAVFSINDLPELEAVEGV